MFVDSYHRTGRGTGCSSSYRPGTLRVRLYAYRDDSKVTKPSGIAIDDLTIWDCEDYSTSDILFVKLLLQSYIEVLAEKMDWRVRNLSIMLSGWEENGGVFPK